MPVMPISVLSRAATSLEQLSEQLARTQKVVKYLQEGNLDFENIRARGIIAENIEAGTITANEIAADTITADKLNVDQLSAITADLGTITAGIIRGIEIYGSYIATQEDAYPRVELNSDENLFGAYKDADHALLMRILEGPEIPTIEFRDVPTNKSAYVYFNPSTLGFSIGVQGDIDMTATDGNVQIAASGGGIISLIGTLVNITGTTVNINGVPINSTLTSLQTQINGKANSFSGYTGNVTAGTSTLHFTNGILTSVT
jgi:hypothetical protein